MDELLDRVRTKWDIPISVSKVRSIVIRGNRVAVSMVLKPIPGSPLTVGREIEYRIKKNKIVG